MWNRQVTAGVTLHKLAACGAMVSDGILLTTCLAASALKLFGGIGELLMV
jgi:hypothetical protein